VIFDMDGLLVDTEPISMQTFVEACQECHFEPDLKIYLKCIGGNFKRTKQLLVEGYGTGFPFDDIIVIWRKRYNEATQRSTTLKPGAASLLEYLNSRPLKKAVVTSSQRQNALKKLENTQILKHFDFILCGDQITNGKPDPEMYLTACRELSAAPGKCLALEDSEPGVRSAVSAGLTVIQVPDLIPPSAELKALGHTIVSSLSDVERMLRNADGKA
jgi:HAD superfamily hydrolase (TIGR01509 family)